MEKLEVEYLDPNVLIPYERNAKKHSDNQIERIAGSISEFGFRQPIVVDANNVVVIGHGRLLAAKALGLESVPVVRADDLTEKQIRALRLVDNKTNESEWDFSILEAELVDLELDFDVSDFGFDGVEPEPTEAPKNREVKLAEKFQLIIDCEDEPDMQQKYEYLQEAGIECRVSTL